MDQRLQYRARTEHDAFLQLYDIESASLYAFVLSILGNRTTTDRLTNGLWLAVLRDRHQFHPRVAFHVFLYRRALRLLDEQVMNGSYHESVGAERLHAEDVKKWMCAVRVLRKHSREDRYIFYLSHFSDATLPEVSRITGFSEREVLKSHNRLHRALPFSEREIQRLRIRAHASPHALEYTRWELAVRLQRLHHSRSYPYRNLQQPYRHPVLIFERVVAGIHSLAITTAFVTMIMVVIIS
ncbi:MAG: hypothetical protein HYZ08_00655 [Candidatus Kerfeldbacteria bacterium]|nr:hypothetical protein [Candidatus Kerfeldbacteria bacterium]